MSGWLRRTTTYLTDPVSGEPVATSRTIVWPGGRVETVPARDLAGVIPEKRAQGGETGVYRPTGNMFLRSPAEMRSKAERLASELGLSKRTLPASPTTTSAAKARTLASALGLRTKPDDCDCPCEACKDDNCESCDCSSGCEGESCGNDSCSCADHRDRRLYHVEGRTIHPTPFIGDIIEEKRIDTAVYEARMRRKLATAR
jgi:hypothetical protein